MAVLLALGAALACRSAGETAAAPETSDSAALPVEPAEPAGTEPAATEPTGTEPTGTEPTAAELQPATGGSPEPPAREAFQVELPAGDVTLDMMPIPGGTLLGAGGPVEIAPFWMSSVEVPWEAYDVFLHRLDLPPEDADADAETRPSKPYINMDRGFGHQGYPALSMSDHGARMFCAWLSEASGRHFRLPTADEWDWACLARNPGPWQTGNTPEGLEEYAWFRKNSSFKTHPVGQKRPNAFGLYDMHGNAAEWAESPGGGGVVVGGSYRDGADGLRAGSRVEPTPDWNASDPQIPKSVWWLADAGFIGFRVVCDE